MPTNVIMKPLKTHPPLPNTHLVKSYVNKTILNVLYKLNCYLHEKLLTITNGNSNSDPIKSSIVSMITNLFSEVLNS